MADETTPETPEVPETPEAPKKPAARKPTTSGPGAAPRKPAAKKPAATPPTPDAAAPAAPEPMPTIPVPPVAAEPVAPTAVIPEVPAVPVAPSVAAASVPSGAPAAVAGDAGAVAPPKRKIWPFVLGGGILVFVLIVAGLIFAVGSVLGAFSGDPKKTVSDYDLSFKNVDCELFQSTTTEAFQDNFFEEGFDCAPWIDNAEALTVDGEYQYFVKIVISKSDGDNAEVVTNETDTSSGDPVDYTLRYYLTKVDGAWRIDGIDNES